MLSWSDPIRPDFADVMVRGIERGKIFYDDADRDNFVSRLGDLAADTQT